MRNKKIFILIAVFSIATISAFNLSINTSESGLSNVSLDNVEALAQETSMPGCASAKGFCSKNGITVDHISLQ